MAPGIERLSRAFPFIEAGSAEHGGADNVDLYARASSSSSQRISFRNETAVEMEIVSCRGIE